MKLYVLVLLSLCFNYVLAVQSGTDSKLNGTFVLSDSGGISHSINYEFLSTSNTFTLTIFDPGDSSTHISVFYEMSLDVFKTNFKKLANEVVENVSADKLDQESIKTFYQINLRIISDDEPLTSRFILRTDSVNSYLSSNSSIHYSGPFSKLELRHFIKDLEMEIEYGALKNISLRVAITGRDLIRDFLVFKNLYPFTSSSKFDPEGLLKLKLYCQNCGGSEGVIRFVRLGDLLQVDNILENYKEDYSPYNQAIIIAPSSPIKEVRKERRSKIIDFATYTDFNGFNGDKPNGLVQVEASRRINLLTKHIQLGSRRDVSNYFDYSKIAEDPVFVSKPSKYSVIIKLKFKQTYYDSLQVNIVNTRSAEIKYYKGRLGTDSVKVAKMIDQYNKKDTTSGDFRSSEFRGMLAKDALDIQQRRLTQFRKELARLLQDSSYMNKEIFSAKSRLINAGRRKFIKDVTHRYSADSSISLGRGGYYAMKLKPLRIRYVNFLGYFEPVFRYSKIEKNNKVLELPESAYRNGMIDLNISDLYQFQKISLGAELNLLKLSFPQTKINYYINYGMKWHQTSVKSDFSADADETDVGAYNYNFSGTARFNPDGRWGCSIGMEYSKTFLLTRPVFFSQNNEMLHYKFDAFLNTNRENKVFFRFRLHSRIGNRRDSFSQIQFGYAMNIFQVSPKSSN